jgi:hypothetical protein
MMGKEAIEGVFQYDSNFPTLHLHLLSSAGGRASPLLLGVAGKVFMAEGSTMSSETLS